MVLSKALVFILGLQLVLPFTDAYKILFAVPISGKSHWVYAENFVEALLERGHEVTAITNYAFRGKSHSNYTEVLIDPPYDYTALANSRNVFGSLLQGPMAVSLFLPFFSSVSAEYALNDTNVQKLIHNKNLHFDLIINHEIFHDSFLMFSHRFQAPVVSICPFGISDSFDHSMGLLTPYSHVPGVFLPYSDKMTFFERWYNTMFAFYDWSIRTILHKPFQARLTQKYFGHLGELPSIDSLLKSRSVIFINLHRAFMPPRPSMGLVYIGGAHVKEPKALPDDLQLFLDESEHGVIYFSFGTLVDGRFLNSGKLQIFLDALGKLKQRVLWKCNVENIDLPPNVMTRKWLPQIDILAHPNLKLFISHGGLFSNIEAIKFGIPMLVIPFLGDQMRNARRIENAGYGIQMDLENIDENRLTNTLEQLLTKESYRQKAYEISQRLNDNAIHPMDEFIWWTEHVIRTNGAKYLKSSAADMPLISYLLVDVFAATLLVVVIGIYIMRLLIKKICCRKGKVVETTKKRQ